MERAGLGLLIIVLGALGGRAGAADAVPFFKADPRPLMLGPVPLFQPEAKPVMYGPVLPDPVATECGIDDQVCIERHDGRVLTLASTSHAREKCAESTHPESCFDAYDMMAGDFVPKGAPILDDPCAWVVLVDGNIATVSSRKLGITKRLLNHGWRARTFVGACNVKTIAPERPVTAIPMPTWTVRKGEPLHPGTAARAPHVTAPGPAATAPPVARLVTFVPVAGSSPPGPTQPATSLPTPPAASVPSPPAVVLPQVPAPSPPAPVAPPAVAPPPATVAGPPGVTQPPPLARAPVSDAQSDPPAPPR